MNSSSQNLGHICSSWHQKVLGKAVSSAFDTRGAVVDFFSAEIAPINSSTYHLLHMNTFADDITVRNSAKCYDIASGDKIHIDCKITWATVELHLIRAYLYKSVWPFPSSTLSKVGSKCFVMHTNDHRSKIHGRCPKGFELTVLVMNFSCKQWKVPPLRRIRTMVEPRHWRTHSVRFSRKMQFRVFEFRERVDQNCEERGNVLGGLPRICLFEIKDALWPMS